MSEQNITISTVLFVGNIPYSMGDKQLSTLLAEFGEVTSAIVVRDEKDRSRGFGFVRFADEEHAKLAVGRLHGREVDGRIIRVDFARSDSRYLESLPAIEGE